MQAFLTSHLCFYNTPEIDPNNGLIERLRAALPDPFSTVFVCSNPYAHERTVFFAGEIEQGFSNAGFSPRPFAVLDAQNEAKARELIRAADCVVLGGGHVPTQNAFLERIGLKAILQDFDGVLIGISAGTMNSAETVYAQPEEPGEATDPAYRRFLNGPGLTTVMLLPHYPAYRNDVVDGLRVYEDVTYPDSFGRRFYAVPDGSYLHIDGAAQWLCGEAYRIEDGVIEQVLSDGERQLLNGDRLVGERERIGG